MDPFILWVAIISTFLAFGALLFTCDLIERLSNAFIDIGRLVDQFSWHSFSGEMKQILLTMIVHVNEPVTLKCFGSMACSRATFQSVSVN